MSASFSKEQAPRYWGMAGVFPGGLGIWEKGDPWVNKRRFVAEHGFSGGGVGLPDFGDGAKLALLRELAESHGQVQSTHLRINYLEPIKEAQQRLREQVTQLLLARDSVPLSFAVAVLENGQNRFDREVALEEQLSRLSEQLRPAVELAREHGFAICVENHGDYYVSDLVELCRRTPGLEILLDTGNCFLIGERPELIPDEAFPLVRATHWKDHYVLPNLKRLSVDLTGATLGEGHVGLEALYERLLRLHPDPRSVFMMIEWVPDPDKAAADCFEASKRHLAKLSGGLFPFC